MCDFAGDNLPSDNPGVTPVDSKPETNSDHEVSKAIEQSLTFDLNPNEINPNLLIDFDSINTNILLAPLLNFFPNYLISYRKKGYVDVCW